MSLVPASDARRAAATAALLSSDKDGEALNAARAMCRLLNKHGLSAQTVVEAGLRAVSMTPRTRTQPTRSRPAEPVDLRRQHQALARLCLARREVLTDWEVSFCLSLVDRPSASPKQKAILQDIAAKIGRASQ